MQRALTWILGGVAITPFALLGCGTPTQATAGGDSGTSGGDTAATAAMSEGMSTTTMPTSTGSGSADDGTTAATSFGTDTASSGSEGSQGTLGDSTTLQDSSSGTGTDDNSTGTASSSGSSSSSSSDGSSGSTGGGNSCVHDVCSIGPVLTAGCDGSDPTDGCVADLCAADTFCCNGYWDPICVGQVFSVCAIDCAAGLEDCAALFSGTPGYYLCSEGFECAFGFNATQGSCGSVCTAEGTECIDAFNNNNACGLGGASTCAATSLGSAICICSNGCGGGPACPAGVACSGGTCM